MTAKRTLADTGEITERTFADYIAVCTRIVDAFGRTRQVPDLRAEDFDRLRVMLAKTRGPVALGNEIQRVRSVFKFAYDVELIDRPVRFGPTFKRPSKKTLRKVRNEKGPRLFEAKEIRAMLEGAGTQLKAMILLGINCGFGNSDVANLPRSALSLTNGWIDYPRPKTGVQRRCPLWPETVAALQVVAKKRPKPKDLGYDRLVFVTKYGQPWAKVTCDNPVTKEMTKLLKSLRLHRPGLNFYALRHTFETVAGEAKDQVAVDHIMGHARDDMASVYRERISDERLLTVTKHVRGWLFRL
ncbi:MAG: tyrosine-type recombinase/integrase [Pirellulales bacterium]